MSKNTEKMWRESRKQIEIKKYLVNGEWMTEKRWKDIVCDEMNEVCEHQDLTDLGNDKNGDEYIIQWKPIICKI